MKAEDRQDFVQMFTVFAIALKEDYTPEVMELWWRMLEMYDAESVTNAFVKHTRKADFFPKPAQIIAILDEGRDPNAAWIEAKDAVSRIGGYQSVMFADPVAATTIRLLGGWIWFCDQDLDGPWTQKRFLQIYEENQGKEFHNTDVLPGAFRCEKAELIGVPDKKLLGQPDKSDEVLKSLYANLGK